MNILLIFSVCWTVFFGVIAVALNSVMNTIIGFNATILAAVVLVWLMHRWVYGR